MGRARENFNNVYFRDETGRQMSFAAGSYANVLRHIFWNLMDGSSKTRESDKCSYVIEAWGRKCFLVQRYLDSGGGERRYEIMNCTYEQLRGKIASKHTAEEALSKGRE